ncbi:cytochrome P450 [Pseudoalteromonas fenneropenaei]|uniref:Cytochrome P450 n=1 Tax=Pseudoalteromonas fenneropenaei TaxID=1737459 RepID=A0ABV7CJV0_9GAMM
MKNTDSAVATPAAHLDLNKLTPTMPTLRMGSDDWQQYMWGEDYHLIINEFAKKYGNIYAVETAKGPLVVLSGYDYVKDALVTQNDVFNIRADFEILQISPQKHFLELEAGPAWSLHRKVFATAMRDYFAPRWPQIEDWMTTEINDIAAVWKAQGEVPFDPNREVSVKLASFLHKVMFDDRFGDMEKQFFDEQSLSWLPNGFINSVRYELMNEEEKTAYYAKYGVPIEKFSGNLNALDAYVTMNVERRKLDYQAGEFRDLCDYLIAASDSIDDASKAEVGIGDREVIIGSLTQVAGAGGGVGAFAMRWALLYLACYPEYQRKVQEELDRVVGKGNVALQQHKTDLPYTQAFISEVLRHCSITAMPAANYAASQDTLIDGYFIAAGTPIAVNNYSVTRDSTLWDEPDRFDPARFLEANGELSKKQQGKAFPFGIGQRRCLGENFGKYIIHTLFAQLAHQFEFRLPDGVEPNLKAISGVFLVPEKVEIIAKAR